MIVLSLTGWFVRYGAALALLWASQAPHADTICSSHHCDPAMVTQLAGAWLRSSPLFQVPATAGVAQAYTIDRVLERFVNAAGMIPIYEVRLHPHGYLLVNSDDRLDPVFVQSTSDAPDWREEADNVFLAMVTRHLVAAHRSLLSDVHAARFPRSKRTQGDQMRCDHGAQTWSQVFNEAISEIRTIKSGQVGSRVVPPLLLTKWTQWKPYNDQCPSSTNTLTGYGGRAPTGCVPTAAAQVLNYYQWPPYGNGCASYWDTVDGQSVMESADFSLRYDWANTLPEYSPWSSYPTQTTRSIARLMHDLGVACRADYEAQSTSASLGVLATALHDAFYYSASRSQRSPSLGTTSDNISQELRSGYPVLASIPGHAFVVDGLSEEPQGFMFHVNYGWGGSRDDWYNLGDITGQALEEVVLGLRPQCMPIFHDNCVTNTTGSQTLEWDFPSVFTNSLGGFRITLNDDILAASVPPGNRTLNLTNMTNGVFKARIQAYDGKYWHPLSPELTIVVVKPAGPPSIVHEPIGQSCAFNDTVEFVVGLTNESSATYQWRLNGVPIEDDEHFQGVDTVRLLVRDITSAQAGEYGVVVTTPGGLALASSTAALHVMPASGFGVLSSKYSSNAVETVITFTPGTPFLVEASRDLKEWWTIATWNAQGVTGDDALTFSTPESTQGDSSGLWAFLLKDRSQGTLLHRFFRLAYPTDSPTESISVSLEANHVATTINGTLVLLGRARGSGPYKFQWRRNGVNLSPGVRFKGIQSAELSVVALRAQDSGKYSLKMWNPVGSVVSAEVDVVVE